MYRNDFSISELIKSLVAFIFWYLILVGSVAALVLLVVSQFFNWLPPLSWWLLLAIPVAIASLVMLFRIGSGTRLWGLALKIFGWGVLLWGLTAVVLRLVETSWNFSEFALFLRLIGFAFGGGEFVPFPLLAPVVAIVVSAGLLLWNLRYDRQRAEYEWQYRRAEEEQRRLEELRASMTDAEWALYSIQLKNQQALSRLEANQRGGRTYTGYSVGYTTDFPE